MALTILDPNTALVIIDAQDGIVAAPTVPYTGPQVVARATELASAFRSCGNPVVLVRVTAATDGADAIPGRTESTRPGGTPPTGWDSIVAGRAGIEQLGRTARRRPARCAESQVN